MTEIALIPSVPALSSRGRRIKKRKVAFSPAPLERAFASAFLLTGALRPSPISEAPPGAGPPNACGPRPASKAQRHPSAPGADGFGRVPDRLPGGIETMRIP